jgi:maleate cis-trans isomerase
MTSAASKKNHTARARLFGGEAPSKPDGFYIPYGGWGSMHNIDLLERDLDTTVITWMNVMIWASMKRGNVAGPINGFGELLATL